LPTTFWRSPQASGGRHRSSGDGQPSSRTRKALVKRFGEKAGGCCGIGSRFSTRPRMATGSIRPRSACFLPIPRQAFDRRFEVVGLRTSGLEP
jgi:hypothetical protein